MARHCMRPGCDRLAAARLTYDTESAAVWLDRPAEDSEPSQQVCSIHAATLTAPLGWTVTDRRLMSVGPTESTEPPTEAEGPLAEAGTSEDLPSERAPFEATASADTAPAESGEPAGTGSEGVVAEPGFPAPDVPGAQRVLPLEDPAAPAEVVHEPEPLAASASAGDQPKVKSGPSAALPEPPKPRSGAKGRTRPSLLDRAFEWTGPQHSVLTTDRVVRGDRREAQRDERNAAVDDD